MPSGGIASTGDNPNLQLMSNEEMRAAIETAHSLGMKVAAHLYPAAAIENAVRAGVDSVEHGSFATARTFALMKSQRQSGIQRLLATEAQQKRAPCTPARSRSSRSRRRGILRAAAERYDIRPPRCATLGTIVHRVYTLRS
jgi:imidazolonepropionase-like amidohydrolase